MIKIDEAIEKVEELYQTVAGKPAPKSQTPHAPIPAEKDPSQYVEEQMKRLLSLLEQNGDGQVVSQAPPLSLWESKDEILLCLELPSVTRDNLELSLQGNVLTVNAKRPDPAKNGHRLRMTERPFGPYQRTVVLPAEARCGELKAQMKEGVLEIRIPKEITQVATPQAVPVQ